MPTSIFEHLDLMWIVILGLITVIVWLLKGWHKNLYTTLEVIAQAISKNTNDIADTRAEVAELRGAIHGRRVTDRVE